MLGTKTFFFPYIFPSDLPSPLHSLHLRYRLTSSITRPEDSAHEVECMKPGIGQLQIFPSIWGHWAGGPPGNMEDVKWLDERLVKILAET